MFRRISTAEARQLIQQQTVGIIDVRDAGSYQRAHVPEAVLLTDQALRTVRQQWPRERPMLVYCYHGNTSQDFAKLFSDFGFAEVYSMDGGFEAWKIEYPVALPGSVAASSNGSPLHTWMQQEGFAPGEVNGHNSDGVTPLIRACQVAAADFVEELIKAGADLQSLDSYGNDALWAACYSEDLTSIELMVKAGADLNRQNSIGATALIYAASAGKPAVVAQLLSAGADPSLKTEDDFTALELAADENTLNLLRAARRSRA